MIWTTQGQSYWRKEIFCSLRGFTDRLVDGDLGYLTMPFQMQML